ncbi:hypothetical protein L3V82_07485 [Thiotrichales bacterium 19S3-7]|nr:hypothetical protein [Thiotrichales bacterium 19S3-7]MCF6801999.1 hypothetical protein [Thiotrichales bacterium 19S3-11]
MSEIPEPKVISIADSKVTQDEWDLAEEYFTKNPTAIKFRRKGTTNKHSFIKIEDENGNSQILAFNFNKDKATYNQGVKGDRPNQVLIIPACSRDKVYFIKRQIVNSKDTREDVTIEREAANDKKDTAIGSTERVISSHKSKSYIVYENLGVSYHDYLETADKAKLTREMQYDLAILAAIEVAEYHAGVSSKTNTKRAHLDLKPGNITIGSDRRAHLIDLAFSEKLSSTVAIEKGTLIYLPKNFNSIMDYTELDKFALIRIFGLKEKNIYLNNAGGVEFDRVDFDNQEIRYIFQPQLIDSEVKLKAMIKAASGEKLYQKYQKRSVDTIAIELIFLRNHIDYDDVLLDTIDKDTNLKQLLIDSYKVNPELNVKLNVLIDINVKLNQALNTIAAKNLGGMRQTAFDNNRNDYQKTIMKLVYDYLSTDSSEALMNQLKQNLLTESEKFITNSKLADDRSTISQFARVSWQSITGAFSSSVSFTEQRSNNDVLPFYITDSERLIRENTQSTYHKATTLQT